MILVLGLAGLIAAACQDPRVLPGPVAGPEGCPEGSRALPEPPLRCVLSGTVDVPITLTPDREWLLAGLVTLDGQAGTVLTVEPGTVVKAIAGLESRLVVQPGARLDAQGTASLPVVLTSYGRDRGRAPGDWVGLLVRGPEPGSPHLAAAGLAGDDPSRLRFVRLEFAGGRVTDAPEGAALTLRDVGPGTLLDHVQIHASQGAGLRLHGGATDLRHVLVTAPGDDAIRWSDGWRGRAQFLAVQQREDAGRDGLVGLEPAEAVPGQEAGPTLSHVTLVGSPASPYSGTALRLQNVRHARLVNVVLLGFARACLDLEGPDAFEAAAADALSLDRSRLLCMTPYATRPDDPFPLELFYEDLGEDNRLGDAHLWAPFDPDHPDLQPFPGGPATQGGRAPDDPFFTPATYVGAVAPDTDWTEGWTTTAWD
jgi:hypothetical protein